VTVHLSPWFEPENQLAVVCKAYAVGRVTWPSGRLTTEMIAATTVIGERHQRLVVSDLRAEREWNLRHSVEKLARDTANQGFIVRRRRRPKARFFSAIEWA
jgi:hypothetical protein